MVQDSVTTRIVIDQVIQSYAFMLMSLQVLLALPELLVGLNSVGVDVFNSGLVLLDPEYGTKPIRSLV